MTRIYITHCSGKKDSAFKGKEVRVTPDKLYTAAYLQRLVKRCKQVGASWAIFSDEYDVVFPDMKIKWYDKSPNSITNYEYQLLLQNLIKKLSKFDEIWFYHMPTRFHWRYRNLVEDARKAGLNITLFSHIDQVR
jgi:hypothetical protein